MSKKTVVLLFTFPAISALFAQAPAIAPNSWGLGTPLPTAREAMFVGVVGTKIYVIGGGTGNSVLSVNEVYDTAANSWSTGAPLPTARWAGASAVVNNIIYTIGGANASGSSALNIVEAYDPTTNSWSTKAPVPILVDSMNAVVAKNIIYLVGGYAPGHGRLATFLSYNPANDAWISLAPLLIGKSSPALGAFGSKIVAAGGLGNQSDQAVTPDNEVYDIPSSTWTSLAPMPTARNGACYESVGGLLFVAGGNPIGNSLAPQLNTMDYFDEPAGEWTTGLPTMPYAVVNAGSASVDGVLYCLGGSNNGNPLNGTVFSYLQIYSPAILPPVINPRGVISASGFGAFPSIAPGTFIEIYGSNLASDTRGWTSTDFNGINAPTTLDGTSVSIGGESAFVNYISPGQVNVLVPSTVSAGPQQLTVTTTAGTSSAYSVNVNSVQPGLLAPSNFKVAGIQYVVALFTDGAYVLPIGTIAGLNSRPAKPGDIIILYGVGFGPVIPNIPAGQLAQETSTLADSFEVSIGGTPATVDYAGLAPDFTGLYQFNIEIPNVIAGTAVPLTFSVNGSSGTQTLYLAIGN